MRKEFMVKEQVGELGKKTHPMDDRTRLGATSSEGMGRKEDDGPVEEVDSRVAEIDHRREIARSTTRLRSGHRRFLYFIPNLIDSKFIITEGSSHQGRAWWKARGPGQSM
jgi:hypothetical protein